MSGAAGEANLGSKRGDTRPSYYAYDDAGTTSTGRSL